MVCTIKLDLPDDLYADVKRVSSSLGITIEEFIIKSLEEACAKYKQFSSQ